MFTVRKYPEFQTLTASIHPALTRVSFGDGQLTASIHPALTRVSFGDGQLENSAASTHERCSERGISTNFL
ncbi:hypothetical protein RRG08_005011 [Elysia crispata]|uniref:Uncharacterized protein n=1 Tax=Elysia crispata TaxID=231223 RepID=A0AAE1E9N2_9GAST|nr:hypothetical protein RRG08_005011 [Elysia crispata]